MEMEVYNKKINNSAIIVGKRKEHKVKRSVLSRIIGSDLDGTAIDIRSGKTTCQK